MYKTKYQPNGNWWHTTERWDLKEVIGTVWLARGMRIATWEAVGVGRVARQRQYSDLAICQPR